MKVISATTIGKLIEAHRNGDEEKFCTWANFIADAYEENGDANAARLIRNRINGVESIKAVLNKSVSMDKLTVQDIEVLQELGKSLSTQTQWDAICVLAKTIKILKEKK